MFDTATATAHDTLPALAFRRRTYAESLEEMRAEQECLLADIALGERWIAETLDPPPCPGECFVIFALTTWGGWRMIYLHLSAMTRFLAVRCARAAADPSVRELRIFRGDPDVFLPQMRKWRRENGVIFTNVL